LLVLVVVDVLLEVVQAVKVHQHLIIFLAAES
jgi:hypothetical protein